jgi:pimeloyl-ACP methyl ester carboxylesterase
MAFAAAVISEQVLVLGPTRSLVGILTRPMTSPRASDLAVVLLNAGMIHRAGPARLYVHLARALAKQGVTVLRVDLSNLGDSEPRADNLPLLEAIVRDPQDVMDDLERMGYSRFILAGICSGAYSAFKTACRDMRVIGAGLLNPQDFIDDSDWISHAWAQRYWKKSLFSSRAWINLLTGRIGYLRLVTVLSRQLTKGTRRGGDRQVAAVTHGVRLEIDALLERQVQLLLVFSASDVSVEQFSLIFGSYTTAEQHSAVSKILLPDADHLFGRSSDQTRLVTEVGAWVARLLASPSKSAMNLGRCEPTTRT